MINPVVIVHNTITFRGGILLTAHTQLQNVGYSESYLEFN
jgi:hypothetical protein